MTKVNFNKRLIYTGNITIDAVMLNKPRILKHGHVENRINITIGILRALSGKCEITEANVIDMYNMIQKSAPGLYVKEPISKIETKLLPVHESNPGILSGWFNKWTSENPLPAINYLIGGIIHHTLINTHYKNGQY